MARYRIQIKGRGVKEFLRYLVIKKIQLYNIYYKDNEIRITISKEDYEKIINMNLHYEIRVLNTYGFSKINYLVFKYKYLLIFSFLMLIIFYIFSNFVFKIEVVHQKEEIRELIINDLKEYGISKYKPIVSYKKKEEIRRKILEKEKDKIEWLEIDNVGTKYIINVEERLLNQKKDDNSLRDIIAKKDAMILSIEANSGEVIKKKYDYVKKGDTIISGTIMKKDKEMSKVKADGKILGEIWYKIKVELPEYYHEETRTGDTKKVLTLKLVNKKISFPFTKNDKSYEIENKSIIKNRLLPLELLIEEKHELKITDKKYNLNNSEKAAIKKAEEILQNKIIGDYKILYKKVLKKTMNNSTIVVDMFFKVQEDITDYKKISSELKEGEESGNNN